MTVVLAAIENLPSNVHAFDAAICEALEKAIKAGIPQAYVVAVLQGHLQHQTQRMLDNS